MDKTRRQVLDGGRRRSERRRQELALERVERVAPPTSILLAYPNTGPVRAKKVRRREHRRLVVPAELAAEGGRRERRRHARAVLAALAEHGEREIEAPREALSRSTAAP